MVRGGYVYILTNYNNSVLYTGVTSNIKNRLFEHKNNTHPNSFTSKYNVKKLIFIQSFNTINEAIHFEKCDAKAEAWWVRLGQIEESRVILLRRTQARRILRFSQPLHARPFLEELIPRLCDEDIANHVVQGRDELRR